MRKKIELKMMSGVCEAYEISPDENKQYPAVLFLMDAIGIRESLLQLAEKIAKEGFFVFVPNIFYRDYKLPFMDYPKQFTREELGPVLAQVRPCMDHLPGKNIDEDAALYVGHLKNHPMVEKSKLSTVGYCFGGRFGIRVASNFPDDFKAVVSLHGGNLVTDAPDSPHLLTEKINARFFFGHADHDSSMPTHMINILEETLEKFGKEFKSETYSHSPHGFTQTDLPAFKEKASRETFKEMMGLFKA